MILLDTNLLGRITDSRDRHCTAARKSVKVLSDRGEQLVIVPQNLYEFWSIATRKPGAAPSGQNGLGMKVEQASQWLMYFQRRFTLLVDQPDLPRYWLELVRANGIKGFRSYDARLFAAMQCYSIGQLLTFNASDFAGLGIEIVDPTKV